MVHRFVVAKIAETALLGLDFLRRHRFAWDWQTGELVFQDEQEDQGHNLEWVCCIQETQEVLPMKRAVPMGWLRPVSKCEGFNPSADGRMEELTRCGESL